MKLARWNDRRRRGVISVKHVIGSQEIAMVLFQHASEVSEKPSRGEVLTLVREVAFRSGQNGLWPECGADVEEGYEREAAPDARRAVATVRRLWPDLDDDDLRTFEQDYAMPDVDLTEVDA